MTLIALLLASSLINTASAAEPTGCGPSGTDECQDDDADGFNANAKDTAQTDCADDNDRVYPGAPAAIGDNVKNDCSVSGPADSDDAEWEAAKAAACGKDSAGESACESDDPKISGPAKAGRDALIVKIESCTSDPASGVWAVDHGHYTCVGLLPGWSWSKSTGVASKADNAERSARRAGDAALAGQIGHPSVPEVKAAPASGKTPAVKAVPAVPATGLYAQLEALNARIAGADERTAAALKKQAEAVEATIKSYEARLGTVEGDVLGLKNEVYGIPGVTEGLSARIDNAEQDGFFFQVGAAGAMIGQPGIVSGDTTVTGPITGGGALVASFGPQWYGPKAGHIVVLDLMVGGGGVGSENDTLPASFGTLGVAALWQPRNTDIAIGPKLVGVIDAAGNPFTAQASGGGLGGGMKAIYMLPLSQDDSRSRIGINLDLAETLGTQGTNDNQWANPAFVGSFGVTYIHGVGTPGNWFGK